MFDPSEFRRVSLHMHIHASCSIFGDNKRPFIYFEVIDLGGEPIKNTEYTWMARVSEFRYGKF
jgi:alpha-amylase